MLVSDRRAHPSLALPDLARAAAAAGVDALQVREKDLHGRALLALVREVVAAGAGSALRVIVNGRPISLLLVSSSLINAQLDNSTAGPALMNIRTPQNVSSNFSFNVLANAPAVFLNGQAGDSTNLPAIYREENGLLVTATNPVRRNDSLNIYAAGLGLTSPVVPAGSVSPSNPLATAVLQPKVTLNGVGLPVTFAGLASGQIGVYQISVTVPSSVPLGLSVPLTITQGGQSQTVNVRVVN